MDDDPSQSMQVELFAASMRANYTDIRAFLEALAVKFEGALPMRTRVTRHSSMFSREHQVKEIVLMLDTYHYRIGREGQGPLETQRSHVTRGIVLRTESVPVEQWIDEVAEALARLAEQDTRANAALSRFLIE